jgi:hypothetical protein
MNGLKADTIRAGLGSDGNCPSALNLTGPLLLAAAGVLSAGTGRQQAPARHGVADVLSAAGVSLGDVGAGTLAIRFRGHMAAAQFNAFQEAASRADGKTGIRPFAARNGAGVWAPAACRDAEEGIYLVKRAGETVFETMERKQFDRFNAKAASGHGMLTFVAVYDGGLLPQQITLSRYAGGVLHGDEPDCPAVHSVQGGKTMQKWYDHGVDVTETMPIRHLFDDAPAENGGSSYAAAGQ